MGELLARLFVKDYKNTQDPEVRGRYGKMTAVVGIVVNFALCAVKVAVGLITGSVAIMTDGFHSMTDAAASVVALIGFRLSARPADSAHPYGHARIEYIAGLIVSLIIIVLGVELFLNSLHKVLEPEPHDMSLLLIIVPAACMCVNLWQAHFTMGIGRKINSVALIAAGTDSRNDVISTAVVLAGMIFTFATGIDIDGLLGCAVAVFIVRSGLELVFKTSSPLLGEAPDPELVRDIERIITSYDGVLGIHDLVVHNYGPGRIFASVHVEVDASGDIMEIHDMIDNIEHELTQKLNIHAVAHMDPIRPEDPLVNELKPVVARAVDSLDGALGFHDLRVVPGPTHTNVVFDIVISHECALSDEELRSALEKAVRAAEGDHYNVVVDVDRSYINLPEL